MREHGYVEGRDFAVERRIGRVRFIGLQKTFAIARVDGGLVAGARQVERGIVSAG